MTLRARLAILLSALLLAVTLALVVVATRSAEAALFDSVDDQLYGLRAHGSPVIRAEAPLARSGNLSPRGTRPGINLRSRSDGTIAGSPDQTGRAVAVMVLDADEGVISSVPAGFDDAPLPPPDLADFDSTDTRPQTVDAVSGSLRYRAITGPQRLDGGYALYAVSLAQLDAATSRLRRIVGGAGVALAGAGGLIGWLAVRRETRCFEEVVSVADSFADGDLGARVTKFDERSDVGRLGVGLNAALGRVESAVTAEQEATGRLQDFVDDVAHELRTPVTTIAGWTDLYGGGALTDEAAVDRMVERVQSENGRMMTLVDELVLLARHDTIRPASLDDVDLRDLILNAVDDAATFDSQRTIVATVDQPSLVRGDRERLQQVIANLLENARKHTPPGTRVQVGLDHRSAALSERPREVEITISDNGPGINAADVERVFDRRFRSSAGSSQGRGLGLAIVKTIVEDHGGSITLTSKIGHGTTVTVTLPTTPANAPRV